MDRTITSNQAFTLVELMIVIAMAGIIMTIAMHNYTRVSQAASETEDLEKISSFLQSKRLTAFTEKTKIAINISSSGKTISAVKDPAGTAEANGSITLNNGVQPASSSFSVNSRGLFSTTGHIRLASLTNSTSYSCVAINNTRIRLGGWDDLNAKCDAK